MSTVVIVFMIVATIFALLTIVYVAIDLFFEKRKKKASDEETEETAETEISEEDDENTVKD